ncbi:MAG: iron uptake porin [Cyanobacteriota bacterium]|nr:iron uptake porin [Cyanobacteriota bacterium]
MNSKNFEFCLRVSPLLVGFAVLASGATPVRAQVTSVDELSQLNAEGQLNSQVTSVSQLSDVQPTDWAFQALQSLVERYGCIAGYPDGTYRGNQATTRYEFAAGLNACLDQILNLVPGGGDVSAEDLAVIRRLQEEFAAELATLRGRVDALEGRTAELEANQFSTTTKLKGEVIFSTQVALGEERALNRLQFAEGADDEERPGVDDNITFSDRVRLSFDTSFTGRDRLRTRLQAANFTNLNSATGTDESRLGYASGGGNDVSVNRIHYRTAVGDKLTFHVGPTGMDIDQIFAVTNPYLASGSSGALSRFGRRHPLVHRGNEGAGVGFNYDVSDAFGISALYLANGGDSFDPTPKNGLFNGRYSAAVQFDVAPTDDIDVSLTYLNSYSPGGSANLAGSTGTDFAQDPFRGAATSGHHLGLQANARLTDTVSFGGWAGAVFAEQESGDDNSATVVDWAVNLAFPDLGGDGNLLAFIVGQPPRVVDNDLNINGTPIEDRDATWHFEALYRFALTKKISITPGAFYILNPEGDDRNDGIFVGAIRTTFKF